MSIMDKYPDGGEMTQEDWNTLMQEIEDDNENDRKRLAAMTPEERDEVDYLDSKLFQRLIKEGKMRIEWK